MLLARWRVVVQGEKREQRSQGDQEKNMKLMRLRKRSKIKQ